MLIAQITDCHIRLPGKPLYGALDTTPYLERAVAALNVLDPRPDLVLLTGDLWHFRENMETNGLPIFNTNRAETLASFDRFKIIAKNLNATVVIQHDARDINKLPAFPAAAR